MLPNLRCRITFLIFERGSVRPKNGPAPRKILSSRPDSGIPSLRSRNSRIGQGGKTAFIPMLKDAMCPRAGVEEVRPVAGSCENVAGPVRQAAEPFEIDAHKPTFPHHDLARKL